jgi:hypothetical protein
MTDNFATDFDEWIVGNFRRTGSFTLLIVLVEIGDLKVELLRSSYLPVIGDEILWPEMLTLFEGSGADWNGAAFFQADRGGLITDALARLRLAELTEHLRSDRSILSHAEFFDRRGLRLKIEEVTPQS